VHWDMATELVAIEDSQNKIRKPVSPDPEDPEIAAPEIEPTGPVAQSRSIRQVGDADRLLSRRRSAHS
jgi:hypothetical protein